MNARGMNPRSLAHKAGVGDGYVYDLLRGKSKSPKAALFAKVEIALGEAAGALHHLIGKPPVAEVVSPEIDDDPISDSQPPNKVDKLKLVRMIDDLDDHDAATVYRVVERMTAPPPPPPTLPLAAGGVRKRGKG